MNSMSGSANVFSRGDIVPKGFETAQLQQYTPQQMKLLRQMMRRVKPNSDLARLAEGDEEALMEMEAPAMRQFNELQSGLASRFSGAGSFGNRRSSGFQNQSSAAASNFAQDLAAKRQDLMRQARNDLFTMSNELLGKRPYERAILEKQQKNPETSSGWGGLFGAGLGGAAGFLAGGPAGALTGANLGYKAGSAF